MSKKSTASSQSTNEGRRKRPSLHSTRRRDGNGSTIDETQITTRLELIKKAKVGPKFLKYMRAQSIAEAGSLEAAVATIASRDYRKAITTLEEQIAKAEASHANFS